MRTIESLESRRLLAVISAGNLDPQFGNALGVELPAREDHTVDREVVQSDGRIVVAGHVGGDDWGDPGILWRFNRNGTLDKQFGNEGIARFKPAVGNGLSVDAMVIDPTGRFVVAGNLIDESDVRDGTFIARFNPDGSLDTTFGDNGFAAENSLTILPFSTNSLSLVIARDGKILFAGNEETSNALHPQIARFNSNGSIDQSFGDNGVAASDIASTGGGLLVTADGGGEMLIWSADVGDALLHFSSDGTFDSSATTLDPKDSPSNPWTLQMQPLPNSKFALLARRQNQIDNAATGISVRVFNANGQQDKSFGNSGEFFMDNSHDPNPNLIARPDGSMLIIGGVYWLGKNPFQDLQMLHADGSPDLRFASTNGRKLIPIADSNESIFAMRSDGSLVFAGTTPTAPREAILQQFTPQGQIDQSFGNHGTTTPPVSHTFSGSFTAIVTQADGKILAGGLTADIDATSLPAGRDFVARFNPDGSLDQTFGNGNGFITLDAGNFDNSLSKIIPQSDGGFLVSTMFYTARVTSDGMFDRHFGRRGILNRGATDLAVGANGQIYGCFNDEIFVAPANGDPAQTRDLRGLNTSSLFSAESFHTLVVMNDGRLLVGGNGRAPGAPDTDNGSPFVMRLLADGRFDRTFHQNGVAKIDQFDVEEKGAYPAVTKIVTRPNGQIIALIHKDNTDGGIMQLNPDGSADTNFGTFAEGGQPFQFGAKTIPYYITIVGGMDMNLNSDGHVIVVGTGQASPGGWEASLARFNLDGTPDDSFADSGVRTIEFPGIGAFGMSAIAAMTFTHDGEIVVAGATNAWRTPVIAKFFTDDPIIVP